MTLVSGCEHTEENRLLVSTAQAADHINADFYGGAPYPWPAQHLSRMADSDFERAMLCQGLGDWQHRLVPQRPRIWIAGCGTNQAVITALAFPDAQIIGSDISRPSLECARRAIADLSLHNVELREESLNEVEYVEQFDYVLCTGVVHHNADPASTLQRVARALKPRGVLELMVYNRYHRIAITAIQKAVRLLAGEPVDPGGDTEFQIVRELLAGFDHGRDVMKLLESHRHARREAVADTLLQPIEHNYVIASLHGLAQQCGLELVQPCPNQFDRALGTLRWNIRFADPQLRQRYWALTDVERWQIANLLQAERSPHLWFYLMPARAKGARGERQLCETFLETCFVPAATQRQRYALRDGHYRLDAGASRHPAATAGRLSAIVADADGTTPMRELLRRHSIGLDLDDVNDCRVQLTTPQFPFLRAVAK